MDEGQLSAVWDRASARLAFEQARTQRQLVCVAIRDVNESKLTRNGTFADTSLTAGDGQHLFHVRDRALFGDSTSISPWHLWRTPFVVLGKALHVVRLLQSVNPQRVLVTPTCLVGALLTSGFS